MILNKIDYKGKYYILQDEDIELDCMDFVIGTIDTDKITDEYLDYHVHTCVYYGIPPYIGEDKLLTDRINKILEQYE